MTILLVALAFAFAWSIGSHYTGACMGMPYALGAISARKALLLMAPLALLGAWLASGKVAETVGRKLIDTATTAQLVQALVILIAVSFGYFTSMNQALVGAMAGAGTARGHHAVNTRNLIGIVRGWVTGPPTSFLLALLAALAVRAVAGADSLAR